jgi:hypothetical protein
VSIRRPVSRLLLGAAAVSAGALAVVGGLALGGPGLIGVGLAAGLAGCTGAGIAREAPARSKGSARSDGATCVLGSAHAASSSQVTVISAEGSTPSP